MPLSRPAGLRPGPSYDPAGRDSGRPRTVRPRHLPRSSPRDRACPVREPWGKRDRRHAAAGAMHDPADTEPGRKTAGTVVILAGDTIGAVARTSWETTGALKLAVTEFRQSASSAWRGTNSCEIAAPRRPGAPDA